MKDEDKTKDQLVNELVEMRQRLTELRAPETHRQRAEETVRERVAKFEAGCKGIEEELKQDGDRYGYLVDVTSGEGRRDAEINAGSEILELLDALPFYVILVDADHHILLANKAVRQHLGLNPKDIVGKYCPKVVHGLDRPFPGCPLEEAVDKGHAVERDLFDPDSGRWMRSAIYPTRHRNQDGRAIFIHMVHDITERKQAEEEIQRNYDTQTVIMINSLLRLSLEDIPLEELLKRAIDLILSITWLSFESKGSIFLVEDDPDVLVMKAQNGLAKPIQKACARVPFGRCLCGQAALTRETQFADRLDDRHETRYEDIDSHGHYCVPILFADRTLGVINTYLREGHRRDQREEEFQTAIANTLAGIIMRRHTEEAKEKTQAQLLQAQKMEATGILAGGVAHDFNNLLTAIQGHTDLAMMEVDETDPLYRDLRQVRSASMRAANLTRQLLLFSRKQPMKPTPLNINRTINNLLKMLKRLIGEDIVVNTDLELEPWTIQADEGNIEQIIMNLAVNARDAMPEGGKLIIKTENVTLDKSSVRLSTKAWTGRFLCLSVEDTGVGMDKEIIQHIFEPFFTTKEAGKGTGLGLSVVYGIVKQHEGLINVYSEPGQGSTFKVYLPAFSVEPEDKTEETISLQELGGSGQRIMLVEDAEEVRKFAARALRQNGYVVFEAANAKEALDIFEREKGQFHLVFSDVVLPDESGLQLVNQLLSRNPDLLVLLSSGYVDQKSQWPIIRERGFRFLQKPYELPDLLRAIREVREQGK